MDLTTLQRQLRGLITSTYQVSAGDEAYIQAVAHSEHLQVVREIIHWWQAYDVERSCVFTATLIKQRGRWDEALRAWGCQQRSAPFIEQLGPMFLEALCGHDDPLIACVAQFELALIKVKQGDEKVYMVDWAYDPYAVLTSLLTPRSLDEARARGAYRTTIARHLPQLFQVVSVSA
jgi:hypothetical protein